MAGKKGMRGQKGWLVPRRYKGWYLDDLDGRSPSVRGVKYIRTCIELDLGGYDNLSRMESSLIDRIAFLIYTAEEMELAVLSEKKINVNEYLSVITTLGSLLNRIGLKRRAKQISLKDYLNAQPAPQPTEPPPGASPQHKGELNGSPNPNHSGTER